MEEKVVDVEITSEENHKSAFDVEENKKSLTAFILAMIALNFAFSGEAAVVSVVLSIISLCFVNKATGADRKPFTVFNRISKPVAIVCIVVGAVVFTVAIIYSILIATGVIVGAASFWEWLYEQMNDAIALM